MEVIVLAGGLGTRLRSVVHDIPKCMAPIGEQPFLAWLLAWLCRYPVNHIVFSVGYLREQIMDFLSDRPWPFSYDFAVEEQPLGTGGGIRLALGYCKENQVFVVNGDTFYPVDLALMPSLAPVTLALKPLQRFDRYGAVELQGERVTAFHEKGYYEEGLISGGVYALDRSRLDLSSLPGRFSFEKEVLEPLALSGQLAGWVSDAYFIDIGIPEDYTRAQEEIPSWFAVRKASDAVLSSPADTLFLDRDGVLNKLLEGSYVTRWDDFVWMPDILPELSRWAGKFNHIILVTNQRGVGRGLMTDADLARIHARMMSRILETGGRLDLILTCTAISEEDPRRKPHPGMYYEAQALLGDLGACVMLGDSDSDEAFARNCGMDFIRLRPEAVSSGF